MKRRPFFQLLGASTLTPGLASARGADTGLRRQALAGLKQAVEFFRAKVAIEDAYLWRYSEDLARREGERFATATQAWVQPPGTPSVGMALLGAHEATGDAYFLEAARGTARALVKGQLRSGGWDYVIEFDPKLRGRYAYRIAGGSETGANVTTLDDDTTQSALRCLMRVDRALQFKEAEIHEAAQFALTALLKAQYPNGAWAQRFDRPPEPSKHPIVAASYPETWSRTWPGADYRGFYTFNDNNLSIMIDTLLAAERTYQQPAYRAAALRIGSFILLSQMPAPQPGWAQQYDAAMHPAWARKFEPPAVTGGEALGVLRSLLVLYRATAEQKYLEPIPRALDYYRASRLPGGRIARFYELKTNKPLYFTKDYVLTYSDADLPTHYSFKTSDWTTNFAREFDRVRTLPPARLAAPPQPARPELTDGLVAQTQAALAALDDQGRWVESGRLRFQGPEDPTRRILSTETFIRNLTILSAYLAASRHSP